MGLRNDIQQDIAEAFDTDLADAVTSFTYREVSQVFDPNTNTTSEVYTDYLSRGVFSDFRRDRITDSSILPTDTKVIVLANELMVEPESENIILTTNYTFIILGVSIDPARAAWVLQCRQ